MRTCPTTKLFKENGDSVLGSVNEKLQHTNDQGYLGLVWVRVIPKWPVWSSFVLVMPMNSCSTISLANEGLNSIDLDENVVDKHILISFPDGSVNVFFSFERGVLS